MGFPASDAGADLVVDQRVGLSGRVLGALAVVLVVSVLVSWWQDAWAVAGIVAALVLVVAFTRARIRIDADGFSIRIGRTTLVDEPIARLVSASTTQVRPIADFGGWGWRIARDGRRGFIAGSGEALVVARLDQPEVVVTMPHAQRAAGVLNALLASGRT